MVKTTSLGRAETLAKPDRQRFDGHLDLRHGEGHLDQLTGRREKRLAVELDEQDRDSISIFGIRLARPL